MARRNFFRSARRVARRGVSYARGDFFGAALEGMGTAALTKRFLGAPLGTWSGAASGAAYGFIRKRNILATAVGGWVHDNIGNVGGPTGAASTSDVRS